MNAPVPQPRRPRLRALLAPLLLALACFLVYNANLRQIGAGDSIPARYLPLLLWQHGTLVPEAQARLFAHGHPPALPRFRPANDDGKAVYFEPAAYWLIRTREHELASFYPVVTPLLVAPLYLPAVRWLDERGWEQPQLDRAAELMEKLAASLLATLASVLVFVLLRREGNRWCLPLALAFAFGTNTWMISSQALWQHGTGELLVALALLLVRAPAAGPRTALLGAVCVLMAANRPPDALLAAAFGGFVLWRDWRSLAWLAAGAAPPLAALLYYNLGFMGELAGGYGVVKPPVNFFQSDWSGLAGLLVSPGRGLLVFSPFLAFVVVGLLQRLRAPDTRALAALLALAVAGQLLLYAQGDWRAGTAWGPRWLTDILPVLVWMLAPAPLLLRPAARRTFAVAIVFSIGVQAVGAFWYTRISDERLYAGDPASMAGTWNPRNVPYLVELSHAPAPGELLCDAHGTLDKVGQTRLPTADGQLPELHPGAVLEGWALACQRSPAQLLLLVNGAVVGTTTQFLPRPDVDAAMGTHAPAGWQIGANLWGVAPGEQVLQLAVRVEPRSDFRIVREQRVIVHPLAPPAVAAPAQPLSAQVLPALAARAAALLREHQTRYGAWLTTHTRGPRYEAPQPELNTFLTATLIDLLAPLAPQHGLAAPLQHARDHLAAQIERNGLVRYHGLPDGPTIGTLGCAITPDADDTALAWRIAGPGAADPRLRPMLDVLAGYRDARGLYRTWLAPRSEYRCLDPGSDPNPADIAIQLHVYLMLRERDPPAAQALCGSLQRSFPDEDIWVYYAKSALLPYLRVAELQQRGCALPLPAERLALPVAGQAIWSEAVHALAGLAAAPANAEAHQTAQRVLAQLGADDFALLRRTPPLLYHNDLSATVRRYYWSEDVGYALWLRLYQAASGSEAEAAARTAP